MVLKGVDEMARAVRARWELYKKRQENGDALRSCKREVIRRRLDSNSLK